MTQTVNDGALNALIEEYIQQLFENNPIVGTYCGLHQYDGRLPDVSKAAIAGRIASLLAFRTRLEIHPVPAEDKEATFDKTLLLRCINYELYSLQDLREFETNPIAYSFLTDISPYIKREYAPLGERLETVITHLAQVPAALAEGRKNLEAALPRVALETAIEMFEGMVIYIEGDVAAQFELQNDPDLSTRFTAVRDSSVQALKDYVEDLKSRRANAHDNFAIGAENYAKMLRYGEMVDLPLEEVLEVGRRNLAENQALLKEVSERFAPGRPVTEVMSEMIKHHPTPEGLVPDTTAKLEEVRQFLIDHEIITVPSEVRCVVTETPPFMRFGFAFMDTPGPFEQVATQSYYYVTPVETHWTEQQKEEWLTKFDYYTLQDVSIHEAYPGHYLHYLHFKMVKGKLRQMLWGANYSYSFVEGWAHYTEQMMIEEGYGAEDPRYQMAQLSEALLRNARYIVSIMMHTQGMTVEEGTRFLMENAYMEETPAASESRRGTFDPGYLNYCLGKLLILKLREDYKREKGDAYTLKDFHDRLLSYGAPPLPLIRGMLLTHDDGKLL